MPYKLDRIKQTTSWGDSKPSRYYTHKELKALKPIFNKAQELWDKLIIEYGKDEGSCILGDSIVCDWLPPRCKYTRDYEIAYPHAQGSITKEVTGKKVLEFLRSQGIECHQLSGRMD